MNRVAQSLEYFPNVRCVGETSLLNMLTSSVFLVAGVTVVVINAQRF
jgi:hypothetical protein